MRTIFKLKIVDTGGGYYECMLSRAAAVNALDRYEEILESKQSGVLRITGTCNEIDKAETQMVIQTDHIRGISIMGYL